jgi:hypothetical protein
VLGAIRVHAPRLLGQLADSAADKPTRNAWWSGPIASSAVTAAWLLLAITHPHTTYHLVLLLTALAWPLAARLRRGAAHGVGAAVTAVLGGAGIALVTTALLAVVHALGSPSLTGSGSALVETLIAVLAGAAVGAALTVGTSSSARDSARSAGGHR